MLNFILKCENQELINTEVSYKIENNILRFRYNNETFKFNLTEKIFIKLSKDTKISIDINKKLLIIDLIDLNQQFMNGINILDSDIHENYIYFKYEVLDEKDKINEIYIKY